MDGKELYTIDIEKLDIQEGDTLIVRIVADEPQQWVDGVRDRIEDLLKILPAGVKVLLCDDEVHFSTDPTGLEMIMLERGRQMQKGFDAANDALWINEELARAAAYYALPPGGEVRIQIDVLMSGFPINKGKRTRIEQLTIAGALVAAEIDRLKAAATRQE